MSSREKSSAAGQKVGKDLNDSSIETYNSKTSSVKMNSFLGFIYALLSSIFVQITVVILKQLSYISVSQHAFVRNIGIFVGVIPIAIYSDVRVFGEKKDRIPLVLGAISSTASIFMGFIAYRYLPLAEASIIISTSPIVTATMARIYLKESCDIMQIICLVLTTTGVLLSLRIPELLRAGNNIRFDSSYIGGLAAAITAVFMFAILTIALRKVKDLHFAIPTIYTGFIGIVFQAVINAVAFPYVPSYCGWDTMLCIAVGIFSFLTNNCYTLAVQKHPAGVVAIERASFDIIVAIINQISFFSIYPDAYVTCGALLVLTSLAILGIRNWLLLLPDNSKTRKMFRRFFV